MPGLTVSELARRVGTTSDTIRYYERIGLLPGVTRSPSGYRLFGDDDVERLRFIKRAQRLGLQLDQIRELVAVRERGLCPCGHVHDLLVEKLRDIEEEIASLTALRDDISATLEGGTRAGASCWSCEPQLYQLGDRRSGLGAAAGAGLPNTTRGASSTATEVDGRDLGGTS